jgi:prepilin-type N-terminal cleavage/methylation domain-containing protein
MNDLRRAPAPERGASLIELMIALVVLSLGILAVARLFPAGTRGNQQDRMMTTGHYYAQQKLEDLSTVNWSDPTLTDGRHPAGLLLEDLGPTGQWHRVYSVTTLPSPMDNCKKVTVTVTWTFMGARSTTATTYLRR